METLKIGIIGHIDVNIHCHMADLAAIKSHLKAGHLMLINSKEYELDETIESEEFVQLKQKPVGFRIDSLPESERKIEIINHRVYEEVATYEHPKDTFHERYGTEQRKFRKSNNRKRTKYRR